MIQGIAKADNGSGAAADSTDYYDFHCLFLVS
jgi:hypothetical protein